MTRYCSWCGMYIGFKSPLNDPSISHGICLRCSQQVIEAAKRKEKQARLDKDHPVQTDPFREMSRVVGPFR
jgi:hypothetical protein